MNKYIYLFKHNSNNFSFTSNLSDPNLSELDIKFDISILQSSYTISPCSNLRVGCNLHMIYNLGEKIYLPCRMTKTLDHQLYVYIYVIY